MSIFYLTIFSKDITHIIFLCLFMDISYKQNPSFNWTCRPWATFFLILYRIVGLFILPGTWTKWLYYKLDWCLMIKTKIWFKNLGKRKASLVGFFMNTIWQIFMAVKKAMLSRNNKNIYCFQPQKLWNFWFEWSQICFTKTKIDTQHPSLHAICCSCSWLGESKYRPKSI